MDVKHEIHIALQALKVPPERQDFRANQARLDKMVSQECQDRQGRHALCQVMTVNVVLLELQESRERQVCLDRLEGEERLECLENQAVLGLQVPQVPKDRLGLKEIVAEVACRASLEKMQI